jgi:protoporphyrinogen IX oxidase
VPGLPAHLHGLTGEGCMSWFAAHYETLRALHLIAVIAWMAGLMYLPRLYVYHSTATSGGEHDQALVVMERRLYRGIMNPAMIVVWSLGITLILARGGLDALAQPWLIAKLVCVALITVCHMFFGVWRKAFERGERPLNHVFFRFINEAPFLLMIIAVCMVVFEPA